MNRSRKPINFTLQQLGAFREIARCRSFSSAAVALHISQPSLTASLKNLELALGARLFNRTTRTVELTEAGRELLPTVDRVVAELEMAQENFADLVLLSRGRVVIGALPSLSADLVPLALNSFCAKYPAIEVKLKDAVTDGLIDMVRSGEVDFAIGSIEESSPDIVFSSITRDTMHLVCSAAHRFSRRRQVAWSEIAEERFIAMAPGTSVRAVTDRAFAAIRRVKAADFEVSLLSTMFGLARAGLGITVLPNAVFEVFTVEGVAHVPLTGPVVRREIGFLTRRGREPTPAAARLMETIISLLDRPEKTNEAKKSAGNLVLL